MAATFAAYVFLPILMQSTNPTSPRAGSDLSCDTPAAPAHPASLAQLEALVEAQSMELELLRSANEQTLETAQYLRTLAHQVRTPLGTILAALGLMEGAPPGKMEMAEFAEYIRFITSAVRRLDHIAESACVLGCLNSGMLPSARAVTGVTFPTSEKQPQGAPGPIATTAGTLASVIGNAAHLARGDAERQTFAQIEAPVPHLEMTPRSAAITEMAVRQIISNALKFSPAGTPVPEVLATLSHDGTECCIRVRDYGIGLSEDMASKLFQPFRRGQNARNLNGEGIGLFIVRRCAQILNGRIEMVNASSIPVPEGEGSATGIRASAPLEQSGAGVLVRLHFPVLSVTETPG